MDNIRNITPQEFTDRVFNLGLILLDSLDDDERLVLYKDERSFEQFITDYRKKLSLAVR